MNALASLRTALRALTKNKLRSMLAMLGIVIAVSAVVATVAIGQGAQAKVAQQMESLGSNLLMVLPGSMANHGVATIGQSVSEAYDRLYYVERVAQVPLSVVCFRYKGSDDENRAIMEKVNASGRVFIASTVLNGKLTLRLAIGNLETTWKDVQEAWDLLQQAAKSI